LGSVYTIVGKRRKEVPLSRVKRVLAAVLVSVLILAMMAAPAFAFHHLFLPGGLCGQGDNAGGDNPTATAVIKANNPAQGDEGDELPLPPTGTPAVEHSERIANPPTQAECPATQN
jgi:hypothetical protein